MKTAYLVLASLQLLFAQNYYPLEISNQWFYDSKNSTVVSDTVISGQQYFVLNNEDFVGGKYVRVDSSYVYYYDTYFNREARFFQLDGTVGDTTMPNFYIFFSVVITSIDTISLFNEQTRVISYDLNSFTLTQMQLSDKFGIIYAAFYEDPPLPWPEYIYDLTGCILSGNKYGTILSTQNKKFVERKFHLFQNYPNPFNPKTRIAFSLEKSEFVEINIFNIRGEKVAVLVSKIYSAGRHYVDFDASDLAGGVYFYRLTAGQLTACRKLLLLK